jgi:hypothetical protein
LQFHGSLRESISQPSAIEPLQSSHPGSQTNAHCPALHAAVVFGAAQP